MCELTKSEYEQDCKPLHPVPFERWFVFTAREDDEPEVFTDELDARLRARECDRLYPRIAPFRVMRMREVA